MATLKDNVWVRPDEVMPVFLEAGTDDSHEYAYLVTNPELWDGESQAKDPHAEQFKAEARASAPAKNAKRAAWVSFAEEFGYEPHEDETKAEIISSLQALEII